MTDRAVEPSRDDAAQEVVVVGASLLAQRLTESLQQSSSLGAVSLVTEARSLSTLCSSKGQSANSLSRTLVLVPSRDRDDVGPSGWVLDSLGTQSWSQVVLLSSAEVHAPSHRHAGQLDECRLSARGAGDAVAGYWRGLERDFSNAFRADEGARHQPVLTVLRPTWTPLRGGHDFASDLLSGSFSLVLPGHDPSIQFLALADLAGAIVRAVVLRQPGTFQLAPRCPIPLRKALRLAGVRRAVVPWWMQAVARRVLQPLGVARPQHDLQRIRYSWTVSDQKAREVLGFSPQRTSGEAIAREFQDRRDQEMSRSSSAPVGPRGGAPTQIHDPFGEDRDYIGRYQRTLWRYLHDVHWRVEEQGLDNVPAAGRAILVGVHRGLMPWDGVMAHLAIIRHRQRYTRFLIHPALVKMPFLFNYMTKVGGVIACRENADWVLQRDGLLGMFPEGIRGAFSMYRDAYRLKRFGRDEFVRMALRNQAPLVPFVTIGSAEFMPIIGRIDLDWWRRFAEWPFLPIAPPFPLLPVPLPSKWHTRFLEPIPVHQQFPPEAADDRDIVRMISDSVRELMQEELTALVNRRRHIFWGKLKPASAVEDGVSVAREALAECKAIGESKPIGESKANVEGGTSVAEDGVEGTK